MKKRKTVKEKTYICSICGKKKKSKKKTKCCSKNMLTEEKGNWSI